MEMIVLLYTKELAKIIEKTTNVSMWRDECKTVMSLWNIAIVKKKKEKWKNLQNMPRDQRWQKVISFTRQTSILIDVVLYR